MVSDPEADLDAEGRTRAISAFLPFFLAPIILPSQPGEQVSLYEPPRLSNFSGWNEPFASIFPRRIGGQGQKLCRFFRGQYLFGFHMKLSLFSHKAHFLS
jgi:hypothetical protein